MTTARTLTPPAWTLAVSAMLCIQLANALSVNVLQLIGPGGTAWLRMCFGAVILWLVARPKLSAVRRKDVPALLTLGAATGLMTLLFLNSVARIPLGTAVSIEFLGPLSVAAVMSKSRRALIWPLLAFVGVLLLSEPWSGAFDLVGALLALASGVCWGLYNVFTQRVGDRFAGITGLSLTIPVAALVTLPVGLPEVLNGEITWWVLPAVAGIALITPVIAFGLEMLALRRMNHTAFGTLLSIEPGFAMLMGLVLLAQLPNYLQLAGLVIVVAAGAAAQRGGGRAEPADLTEISAPKPSK